jgi:glutaredoxin
MIRSRPLCRSLIAVLIAALAVLAGMAQQAAAQAIYRWTDKDGRIHYSGQPPLGTKGAQKLKAADEPADSGISAELQAAVKNHPVTLYQSRECVEPCRRARELLAKRGVPHRIVDVDDQGKFEQLRKLSGAGSVPVLVVGKSLSQGYEQQAWNDALDAAGYPRSAPAGRAPGPGAVKTGVPSSPPKPARELSARLFVSAECGSPCEQARVLLAERGVKVTEISASDPGGFSELQRVSGGATVPVMVIGEKVLKGFAPGQYNDALDKAD